MAILNYTTSIPAEKTIAEIQKILVSHGANKIVADYKDGLPCAVTFCLMIDERMIAYALPANYEGVLNSMKRKNYYRLLWRGMMYYHGEENILRH
jgi:hypothetical protein